MGKGLRQRTTVPAIPVEYETVSQYLDRGGRITQCAPNVSQHYLEPEILLASALGVRWSDATDPHHAVRADSLTRSAVRIEQTQQYDGETVDPCEN